MRAPILVIGFILAASAPAPAAARAIAPDIDTELAEIGLKR